MNILLLHGALGCEADLKNLADALSNKGFEPRLINFSGHGSSAFKNLFTVEQFADELNMVIQETQKPGIPIFGYSMGGYVALYNAFKNKYHHGPVFTLGTKFDWSAQNVEKETAFLNPTLMEQKVAAFVKILRQKHGAQWKELVIKTAELMRDIHHKNYLSVEVFKQISNRVTLGLAGNDQMVSKTETLQVMRYLQRAQYLEFESAKHALETLSVVELSNQLALIIKNEI